MKKNETAVSVTRLFKNFESGENRVEVLKNVSFSVSEGEFVSVMGPSGCGKSTLLYLIGGLETPTKGEVRIFGEDLFSMKDKEQSRFRCREIGFVYQFYNLVENLTVEENILLPLIMAGESPKKHREEVDSLLSFLHLTEKKNAFPTTLSGGQQQRVSIARALVTNPKLILADEPTGNLDSKSGEEVMRLFSEINRERGIAILMVTHSDAVAAYSDRILRMSDGTIVGDEAVMKD